MTERLPSLSLLAAEVRAERELLFRQTDAVDAKAGIVFGFAGAIAVLSATPLDAWLIPGMVGATCAALQCLVIFRPHRHPVMDLRLMRDAFLRSEPAFTQLNMLDAQLAMIDRQARLLRRNEHRLRRASSGWA